MNRNGAKSETCTSDLIITRTKKNGFEGFWWIVECFSNIRWYYGSENIKDDKNLEIATSVMLPKSHIDEKKKFNK